MNDEKLKQAKSIIITSSLSCLCILIGFPMVAFAIEMFVCFSELVLLKCVNFPEKLVHHVSAPVAIACALTRGYPDIHSLSILSFGINVSNLTVGVCKFTYLGKKQPARKEGLLFLSFALCLIGRVGIPSIFAFHILKDLVLHSRPEWARIYATCVLMLLYLNFQITFNLYSAFRQSRCSS
jgi:hypothetical protein